VDERTVRAHVGDRVRLSAAVEPLEVLVQHVDREPRVAELEVAARNAGDGLVPEVQGLALPQVLGGLVEVERLVEQALVLVDDGEDAQRLRLDARPAVVASLRPGLLGERRRLLTLAGVECAARFL
jgi:hypothetical protein